MTNQTSYLNWRVMYILLTIGSGWTVFLLVTPLLDGFYYLVFELGLRLSTVSIRQETQSVVH